MLMDFLMLVSQLATLPYTDEFAVFTTKEAQKKVKTALRFLEDGEIDLALSSFNAALSDHEELINEKIKWREIKKVLVAMFSGHDAKRLINGYYYGHLLSIYIAYCYMLKNKYDRMDKYINKALVYFTKYADIKTEFERLQSDVAETFSPYLGDLTGKVEESKRKERQARQLELGREKNQLEKIIVYLRDEAHQISPNKKDINRDIDYTRLHNLLAAGNWEDADYETYRVMLKVVGREEGDWIRDEELMKFPCTDLNAIDRLWVEYSNKRFGFSVQSKIYRECGGIPDLNQPQFIYSEAWKKFGESVGWKVKGEQYWKVLSKVTYNNQAESGHLPIRIFLCSSQQPLSTSPSSDLNKYVILLFSRIQTCM